MKSNGVLRNDCSPTLWKVDKVQKYSLSDYFFFTKIELFLT